MEVKNKKNQYCPLKKVNDNNVIIMWDYKPITKVNAMGESVETPLAVWQEYRFKHNPTLSEIKDVIYSYYNNKIDNQILSGLTWNGLQVWLSSENQFNYKAAYDLAVQTNGATLPVTFKFGDCETSSYYTFNTLEEITDFYLTSISYVQHVLNEGWKEKDSINWELYQ
jgi:hypothetical protein